MDDFLKIFSSLCFWILIASYKVAFSADYNRTTETNTTLPDETNEVPVFENSTNFETTLESDVKEENLLTTTAELPTKTTKTTKAIPKTTKPTIRHWVRTKIVTKTTLAHSINNKQLELTTEEIITTSNISDANNAKDEELTTVPTNTMDSSNAFKEIEKTTEIIPQTNMTQEQMENHNSEIIILDTSVSNSTDTADNFSSDINNVESKNEQIIGETEIESPLNETETTTSYTVSSKTTASSTSSSTKHQTRTTKPKSQHKTTVITTQTTATTTNTKSTTLVPITESITLVTTENTTLASDTERPTSSTTIESRTLASTTESTTLESTTLTSTTQRSTTPEIHPGKYKLVCFYSSWCIYRPKGECRLMPDKIDPKLCTHLIYAFAKIRNYKLTAYDEALDLDEPANFDSYGKEGNYKKFTKLKSTNAKLKTMLSVGGQNVNSSVFSEMSSSSSNRETFITSAIDLLREYDFDGLDISWQYPGFSGGEAIDVKNFPILLNDLRVAFDKETPPSGKNKLVLSLSVAASAYYINKAYKIEDIHPHVDFINIMTYNYHGATWESFIGHNSPLFKRPDESKGQETLNGAWSMATWHESGAPGYKLLMGIAFFGNTYTFKNGSKHDLGSAHTSAGRPGSCTRQPGILAFNEFCSIKNDNKWTIVRDPVAKVAYSFSDTQWIGFDDEESIEEKAHFITKNGYGGAFIWTIDYDDFNGQCDKKVYPLTNGLRSTLQLAGQLE